MTQNELYNQANDALKFWFKLQKEAEKYKEETPLLWVPRSLLIGNGCLLSELDFDDLGFTYKLDVEYTETPFETSAQEVIDQIADINFDRIYLSLKNQEHRDEITRYKIACAKCYFEEWKVMIELIHLAWKKRDELLAQDS